MAPWIPGVGVRAVPVEPLLSQRGALDGGERPRREAAQAEDQGPAGAGVGLRPQPFDQRRRVDAVSGHDADDLGAQVGSSRWGTAARPGPAAPARAAPGPAGPGGARQDVANRAGGWIRGTIAAGAAAAVLARGQAAEDVVELLRVGVGDQGRQGLGPVAAIRAGGEANSSASASALRLGRSRVRVDPPSSGAQVRRDRLEDPPPAPTRSGFARRDGRHGSGYARSRAGLGWGRPAAPRGAELARRSARRRVRRLRETVARPPSGRARRGPARMTSTSSGVAPGARSRSARRPRLRGSSGKQGQPPWRCRAARRRPRPANVTSRSRTSRRSAPSCSMIGG